MRKILLIMIFALFLGTSAQANQVPREECAAAIASITNSSLMSRQTAIRKGRALCIKMEQSDRYLFKAITQ